MKNRIIIIAVVLMLSLFMTDSLVFAWSGDTWGPLSRESILRIAGEMAGFNWTPKTATSNHTSNDYPWVPYSPGQNIKARRTVCSIILHRTGQIFTAS